MSQVCEKKIAEWIPEMSNYPCDPESGYECALRRLDLL